MKRPIRVSHWLVAFCLLIIMGQYVAMMWLAPSFVIRMVEHAVGGALRVDSARIVFPLTVHFTDVSSVNRSPESFASLPHVVIKPRWLSAPSRTVEFDEVRIERPLLRITRSPAGELMWTPLSTQASSTTQASSAPRAPAASPWRVRINSLVISDGTIEMVDQAPHADGIVRGDQNAAGTQVGGKEPALFRRR